MTWLWGGLRARLPLLVVLGALVLLGYPLALAFGLPLALRDLRDLRKWQKETLTASAPQSVGDAASLTFAGAPEPGVLVLEGAPLGVPYRQAGETVTLEGESDSPLVTWGAPPTPVSATVYRLGELPDPLTLYVGEALAVEGAVSAAQPPDGVRQDFTFADAEGPVLLDAEVLEEGSDYALDGTTVTLTEPPPFGSDLRRISGDYAVLDTNEGTVVFAAPPGEVRVATSVVRLAEVLAGETNGENRRFTLEHPRVVETDPYDIYVDGTRLPSEAERPEERVDGVQDTFTFTSEAGVVTVDGAPQPEDAYARASNRVTFARPPPRNAQLRQYGGAFLADAETGEIVLANAPPAGSVVWTDRYTVYARPACGSGVWECFLALPQHPVPFPHWIAARVVPFFEKFPLSDERNIVRATLYTASGTLAALALGAAVGTLLAVVFVWVRPLERALLPWAVASQTVPIIALVPVLLLVLGNAGITIQTSLLPTALIGAYIAFFPVVVGTVQGLRSVDPLALDLMRSYAASPWQVFTKVRFPAAVPSLFVSLKLATAAALVGALVAETESNNRRGLGFQILGQVQSGNVADVWILLLISALLGIALVALVGLAQRFIAPWERR